MTQTDARIRPADELPSAELDAILAAYPRVAVKDIDMPTIEFIAFLVVEGRLTGDTDRPAGPVGVLLEVPA